MLSVVLLIIGVQYCMNVVCSSLDYWCTILYECCLCSSLEPENIHTILDTYYQENYKDNIHTILDTYNQENYRQHSYNIVTYNQEKNTHLIIGVQYCMNIVCSSPDNRCTILYECCL
jgi:3-methyladenine DNA glycosylase Mpg